MEKFDLKLLEEIQNQFEKIKESSDIEPDIDTQNELEELLGMSFELDEEINLNLRSVELQFQKINDNATIPKYNYGSDSGFDLHSVEEITLPPLGRIAVSTGIKLNIPEGYEIQIRSKSGLSLNQGLIVLNSPGTIDSGYVGEIKVIVFNVNNYFFTITKGMKIAQAVLCPVVCGKYVILENVDDVGSKERKDNGFGSTGI